MSNLALPSGKRALFVLLKSFILLVPAILICPGTVKSLEATVPATRGVTVGYAKRYLVHVTTTLNLPTSAPGLKQVRVWHALPVVRPWSKTNKQPPLTALSYQPNTARFELEADRRSGHIYYETNNPPSNGRTLTYKTDFEFYSADRKFDPSAVSCTWSQYKASDYPASDGTRVGTNVKKLADDLRRNTDPISCVTKFNAWIFKNIRYDERCTVPLDDGDDILAAGRGHCGHIASLFKQMCLAAGIPFRPGWGLALDDDDTIRKLGKTPDKFSLHTYLGRSLFSQRKLGRSGPHTRQ
jgi:Transglutaminase-like enzymes, putative cysteine proteases